MAGENRSRQLLFGGRLARPFLLLLPALALMLPVYGYPMLDLVRQSFDAPNWSFKYYIEVFEDPAFGPVMSRTFLITTQVTMLCVVIGYPIAYAMLHMSERGRRFVILAVVLPLWTSALVRSFAWITILGQEGALNQVLRGLGLIDQPVQFLYTRFAVLIGFVHVLLPFFVFPLYSVMTRLDLRLVDAACSLGASPMRAFFGVFFPLSLPGVAGGALLIFIPTLGYLITPALLGGLKEITYVMLIERQVNSALDWNLAAAMSLVLLMFTVVLVMVFGNLLGFSAGDPGQAKAMNAPWLGRIAVWLATLWARRSTRWARADAKIERRGPKRDLAPFLRVYVGILLVFLLFPLLILLPMSLGKAPYLEFPPSGLSLRWFETYLSRRDWMGPTVTSFQVALATMIAATSVGTLAAIGLSRAKFRGSNFCLSFLMSPLVVPHLIIAVGLYFQFAPLKLVGTRLGLVLAHMIIAIPLVVTIVLSALRNVDLMPEKAARSLGAGPILAFRKTTLVMIRPSLVSSALFAFLASFDDVIMALFLSGTSVFTLPKRMWDSVMLEIDPTVAAVSVVMITLSLILFFIGQWANRGKRGLVALTHH